MDIGLDKAAKGAVDEASLKLPSVEPEIDRVLDRLLEGFKNLLVGRVITITIK